MGGIKDKVAIIGAGCTKFGENWEKGYEDMVVEAAREALDDAGMEINDIDAFWAATQGTGISGAMISRPLKIQYKPVEVTRHTCVGRALRFFISDFDNTFWSEYEIDFNALPEGMGDDITSANIAGYAAWSVDYTLDRWLAIVNIILF